MALHAQDLIQNVTAYAANATTTGAYICLSAVPLVLHSLPVFAAVAIKLTRPLDLSNWRGIDLHFVDRPSSSCSRTVCICTVQQACHPLGFAPARTSAPDTTTHHKALSPASQYFASTSKPIDLLQPFGSFMVMPSIIPRQNCACTQSCAAIGAKDPVLRSDFDASDTELCPASCMY